jgi:lipopolysaccharide/colanic/teichoic acid biosynthesis glycosyltransferase
MAHPEIDAGMVEIGFAPAAEPVGLYERSFKRILDCIFVLLAAPVILPVVLLLGLLIRSDGGPAFYSQERIGLNGRIFRIWKLRSMRVGADQLLEAHLDADPAARAEWQTTQKLKDDPRVTPIGRSIRRNSLDELPQLWNVLKGDMSLVGPRPEVPRYVALYPADLRDRVLSVRPGITDPASLEFRDEAAVLAAAADPEAEYVNVVMPAKLALAVRYVEQASLATDLRLIGRTLRLVFLP